MFTRFYPAALAVIGTALIANVAYAQDQISGPQLGDKLPVLKATSVYDSPGEAVDYVAKAEGKPLVLIFIAQLSRPGVNMARALSQYAESRRGDGLHTAIVWVGQDKASAEEYLNRARNSLNFASPVGLIVDGDETAVAYGLNKQVPITVVVAKEGKVTANFALTIPDVKDVRTVSREIVKLVGGEVPSEESLRPKRP